jgi:TolB-like protein
MKSTRLHGLLLLLVVSWVPCSIAQQSKPLSGALEELASQITRVLPDGEKRRIAIVPFSDLNGQSTVLGNYVAEELTTQIFNSGKLEIVERSLLDKILKELKLGQSGAIDPNTARQVGKIAGVSALVTGTITDFQTYVAINSRLIDAQTGKVVAAASARVIKDADMNAILRQLQGSSTQALRDAGASSAMRGRPATRFADYPQLKVEVGSLRMLANGRIVVTVNYLNKTRSDLLVYAEGQPNLAIGLIDDLGNTYQGEASPLGWYVNQLSQPHGTGLTLPAGSKASAVFAFLPPRQMSKKGARFTFMSSQVLMFPVVQGACQEFCV